MAKGMNPTYVYVLSQEHYHFPPNESDMVASTALEVFDNVTRARDKAEELARDHKEKYETPNIDTRGHVKSFTSGDREYRTWIDWDENSLAGQRADRFVWVVRRAVYIV